MAGKQELKVIAVMCSEKPKYDLLAGELLEACRKFYRDPENEKAYHEWRRERDSGQNNGMRVV